MSVKKSIWIVALFVLFVAVFVFASSVKSPQSEADQLKEAIQSRDKTIVIAKKTIFSLRKELAEAKRQNYRLQRICQKRGIDTNQELREDWRVTLIKTLVKGIKEPLRLGQTVHFEKNKCFKISQIVDRENMIAELSFGSKKNVWFKGLNTSTYVDDVIIAPEPYLFFVISGTKKYETVMGGTKTVFVLEPVKLSFVPVAY